MSAIFQETHDLKNQTFSASILQERDCPANVAEFDYGSSITAHHKVEVVA
jgi:hypothetical protein